MKSLCHSLFAAFRFLTIAPIPERWCGDERDLGRSIWFFPLVGLGLGASVAVLDHALMALLRNPLIVSALDIVAFIALTKGFHLDGLCDTADGFLSSRPKERMLEIMRDSRVGAMGAIVMTATLLVKWSALASLPEAIRWQTILLMPLAGRCALLWIISILSYARQDGGLATIFLPKNKASCFVYSLALALGIFGWRAGWPGLLSAGACVGATLLLAAYFHKKIGGFTGDTLGAGVEIIEIVPAMAAIAWVG